MAPAFPIKQTVTVVEIEIPLFDVRAATLDDSQAVFFLANQLNESICVVQSDFNSINPAILRREESLCLVAVMSSIVVGYITASTHPVLIQGRNSAYIDELVVDIDSRGHKIGSTLMAKMEDWAKDNNCSLVGLATGGASSFYERLDYKSRAGYYKKYLLP